MIGDLLGGLLFSLSFVLTITIEITLEMTMKTNLSNVLQGVWLEVASLWGRKHRRLLEEVPRYDTARGLRADAAPTKFNVHASTIAIRCDANLL